MNLANYRLVNWPVRLKCGDPTIRRQRASGLALRTSLKLLRRLLHRRVQLFFRELRTLDSRRSGHFPLELHLLELFRPTTLVRDLGQRQYHRLCTQQVGLNACRVV